ncbi:aspartyl protease family protein [Rubinisphaera margarita]|uniref:aspartyl protease family protein n=1 Tax=Rubinisphaera margarita TaxID=2909586 RepID=UPI001EE821E7|nr:aspartyl protease family protein [Rubinisphaera margarita]MCG6156381.1 aspartyl protease family protein [Rubinisphaera margarita]
MMRSCQRFSIVLLMMGLELSAMEIHAQEAAPYFEGDRILVNARINEQPVRLLYDTGASFSAILSSAAERLKIEIDAQREQQLGNYRVPIGRTAPVEFAMFGQTMTTPLRVVVSPRKAPFDGVLSWRNVNSAHVLIDGYDRRVLTLNRLPERGWQRWQLEAENSQLFFAVTHEGKEMGRVFVDTGTSCGLRLSPQLWRQWREEHPEAGVTLETFQYFVGDVESYELSWAEEFSLGDLTFRDVDLSVIPESEEDMAIDAAGKEFIAMIGIRALRNLRIIISREEKMLLTQPIASIPDHNRLGAVFIPDPDDESVLRCRVLDGSPAAKAGLRNGDVLASIDDFNFSGRDESGPRNPSTFFSGPAGTRLAIAVRRDGELLDVQVQLEDLLR